MTSHPAGIARYVAPLSRASVAVGADGLMIEVHPDPPRAKSDSQQQLDFGQFKSLKEELDRLLPVCNRTYL